MLSSLFFSFFFFFSYPCFSLYSPPPTHPHSPFFCTLLNITVIHSFFFLSSSVLQVCVCSCFLCFLCFQSYLFLLYPLVCFRQDLSLPPSHDAAAVAPPAAAVVVSPSLLAAVAGFKDALVDLLPKRAHVVVVVGGKLGH